MCVCVYVCERERERERNREYLQGFGAEKLGRMEQPFTEWDALEEERVGEC